MAFKIAASLARRQLAMEAGAVLLRANDEG